MNAPQPGFSVSFLSRFSTRLSFGPSGRSSFWSSVWPSVWLVRWSFLGGLLVCLALGHYRFSSSLFASVCAGVCAGFLLFFLVSELFQNREILDEESRHANLFAGAAQVGLGFAVAQAISAVWPEAAVVRYAAVIVASGYRSGFRLVAPLVLAVVCEVLFLVAMGQTSTRQILLAQALLGLFVALRQVVQKTVRWRQHLEHKQRVAEAMQTLEEQVALFRLRGSDDSLLPVSLDWTLVDKTKHGGTPRGPDDDREEHIRSAAVMVRQNLDALAGVVRAALNLSTCVVLWKKNDHTHYEVVALSTVGSLPVCEQVRQDAGLLGSAISARSMVSVVAPKLARLAYYDARGRFSETDDWKCAAAMVIPFFEGHEVIGMLCADRFSQRFSDSLLFSQRDETVLRAATTIAVRIVQSERVFRAVEFGRDATRGLARASTQLSAALRSEDVEHSALIALEHLCPYDFAALVECDAETHHLRVRATKGDPALCAKVQGLRFSDNEGLCASAVRRRTELPVGGTLRDHDRETRLFAEPIRLSGYVWLRVVPLLLHDKASGCLVVAGKGEPLTAEQRALLPVFANQIAVSLDGARMYEKLEAQALTDGLTGLFNRRTFQERINEMRERAARQVRPLTLLLCDIDHFKKINDTYGHLTGDEVLRKIAKLLADNVRKVDVAARYGGEEFAILLEATDEANACLLAERIRLECAKLVLNGETNPFSCTLSIGVAEFPTDGNTAQELIAAADANLYAAKRAGRNRVVSVRAKPASDAAA